MEETKKFYPELIGLPHIYSKRLYLQYLCNKYGDFKVCISKKLEDGSYIYSKHHSVLELWETDKGLWFLDQVNHRTSLPCEVILDFDENPTELKMHVACKMIKDEYDFKFKAYFSGGKGYHIHIFIPEFIFNQNYNNKKMIKESFRVNLIKKFGTDLLKKSEFSMIALEGCPHHRTSRPKVLVEQWGWHNDI